MTKAFITNSSGNTLWIPADGRAPILFLEWMRDYVNPQFSKSLFLSIMVRTKYIATGTSSALSDVWFDDCVTMMGIRIENTIKQTYIDAREYINSNL